MIQNLEAVKLYDAVTKNPGAEYLNLKPLFQFWKLHGGSAAAFLIDLFPSLV
jgi:hypothetical protein